MKAALVGALHAPSFAQTSGIPAPVMAQQDSVMGYPAWKAPASEDVARWQSLQKQHARMMQDPVSAAIYEEFLGCLTPYRDVTLKMKMLAVDSIVDNMITYTRDLDQFGMDTWSPPVNILQTRKGDCDDFVTLKYFGLRHLGVPADKIHIAIIEFISNNHAIVVVDPGATDTALPLVKSIMPRLDSTENADVHKETRMLYALSDSDGKSGRLLGFDVKKADAVLAMNEKSAWQFTKPKPVRGR